MQSVYSVYGSKLHLVLPDDFADAVNRAIDAFLVAEPVGKTIRVTIEPEDMKVWNNFAQLMNHLTEVNGGALDLLMTDKEIPSDYLVKL